jgi:hypothetical protein
MLIDNEVEPLVREALAASVAEEPDRFGHALRAVARTDDLAARAFALAYAVDVGALVAVQDGTPPDDSRLRYLANSFATTQEWTGIDEGTSFTFLTSLASNTSPVGALGQGEAAIASFAIGGWLLSAFHLGEDVTWTDLLDAILDKLESSGA